MVLQALDAVGRDGEYVRALRRFVGEAAEPLPPLRGANAVAV